MNGFGNIYFVGFYAGVTLSGSDEICFTRVISQLRTEYGDDFGPILKLLNVRGSLGFVIDDTASVGPTLSGVKNSVVRIVNRVKDIPPRFLAQKIQVETMVMACDQEMFAGSQFRALYRVTNRGDTAGDFGISASPSYGSVSRISQPEVALEPGASSEIEVLLDVPADIDDGSVVYVTLTATDAAAPAVANTALVSRLAQSSITSTGNGDGGGGGSGGGCFIYSIH